MQKAALRIDVGMGKKLFDKVLALPLPELESRPNAFWLSLFRDIETVRNTLSGPSAVLLTDLPFALLFVALIVIVAQPLVWVLAVILPLFVLLAWRSAATLSKASSSERKTGFGRDALLAEVIAGRTTVKALALHDSIRPYWEDRHADTIEQAVSRGTKSDRYANIGTALTLCTTLAMTTVGALAIIGGEMTIGSLIAANMLSSRIIGPFNQLVGSWRSFAQFRQSVTRLSEIFDLEEERQEAGISIERPEGDITLDHVVFKYGEEAAPVIDNLRLTIKPHSLVAIMGANGQWQDDIDQAHPGPISAYGRAGADGRRRRSPVHVQRDRGMDGIRAPGAFPLHRLDPRQCRQGRTGSHRRRDPRGFAQGPAFTSTSSTIPTATPLTSARPAGGCRAAFASASPSPAPTWAIRRFS